jgi:hypothetical protein
MALAPELRWCFQLRSLHSRTFSFDLQWRPVDDGPAWAFESEDRSGKMSRFGHVNFFLFVYETKLLVIVKEKVGLYSKHFFLFLVYEKQES